MKTVAIILARQGSTRLPGKALMSLAGRPVLEWMIERTRQSGVVDEIVIATPHTKEDKEIIKWMWKNFWAVGMYEKVIHYWNEEIENENVFDRVRAAAAIVSADIIVDLTADCPFVDPAMIRKCVEYVKDCGNAYTFASNINPRSWPDGFDVMVYTKRALEVVAKSDRIIKAHAGWNILQNRERCFELLTEFAEPAPDGYHYPEWGLTLDEPADHDLLNSIAEWMINSEFGNETRLGKIPRKGAKDIINYLKTHPGLLEINESVKRKTPGEG